MDVLQNLVYPGEPGLGNRSLVRRGAEEVREVGCKEGCERCEEGGEGEEVGEMDFQEASRTV